ncbi:enoyl-CoA hydratase-related protein [Sphingobium sp. H39-3-25]|uniref:enoyl-CoA hydratase/isomerase family protein n=1 Tax=Sphingobium arseniciresistens TaxID=3030834 RepID=UPI0023B8A333|nr:enoyl-CoA hydratase-related protein [Sphingobium arseniciresistens]
MTQPVLFAQQGSIATITFNRPDVGNALNREMALGLLDAVIRCDQDAGIRVVVLTGAGRMFCAGGDVTLMLAAGGQAGHALSELAGLVHMTTTRLARMAKPLVCAVNGPAAGAGLGLGIMGDIVLAAKSAHFTPAYGAIGLTPDGGATFLLPRLIGLRRAQEMLILNRRVGAEEGEAIGLVTRAVDDEALIGETMAVAERLAASPVAAIATVRAQLLGSFGAGLETQLELEARGISAAAAGPEGREGVAAFNEKRKADFVQAVAGNSAR